MRGFKILSLSLLFFACASCSESSGPYAKIKSKFDSDMMPIEEARQEVYQAYVIKAVSCGDVMLKDSVIGLLYPAVSCSESDGESSRSSCNEVDFIDKNTVESCKQAIYADVCQPDNDWSYTTRTGFNAAWICAVISESQIHGIPMMFF